MFFFSFSYIFWGNMKNRNHFLAGPVLSLWTLMFEIIRELSPVSY